VVAAGAVVFAPERRVLLVHRPKYDDWSFPKGKLDRGEHRTTAAVREVAEETGLRVRLGPPLADQTYPVRGRPKRVHYWVGRAIGPDDVSGYRPNAEIDEVAWLPIEKAAKRLSYPHDRDTLAEALDLRRPTRALLVVRHAEARSRRLWHGDDTLRPLLATGRRHVERLVPLLGAFGVERVVTSPSIRCVETVEPFARVEGLPLAVEPRLSEEDATPARVGRVIEQVLAEPRHTAICSHRPVLPEVFEALGVEPVALAPAGFVVVHERKGRVVAWEHHGV